MKPLGCRGGVAAAALCRPVVPGAMRRGLPMACSAPRALSVCAAVVTENTLPLTTASDMVRVSA